MWCGGEIDPLLAATNAAYGALMADSEAKRELEEEQDLWESTLMDGLKGEPGT